MCISAIEVYLANYIPPYQDETFSSEAFLKLKSKLEEHDYQNKIFVADIRLRLGCMLWLQNISEEVALTDVTVPGLQLTRTIYHLKLAEISTSQLNDLYHLCEKANIAVPKVEGEKIKPIKEDKLKYQWAFLDVDNVNEVIFCAAVSPDEIYVRLNKYNDL